MDTDTRLLKKIRREVLDDACGCNMCNCFHIIEEKEKIVNNTLHRFVKEYLKSEMPQTRKQEIQRAIDNVISSSTYLVNSNQNK